MTDTAEYVVSCKKMNDDGVGVVLTNDTYYSSRYRSNDNTTTI